ncbi:hypothetical protein [Leptospira noguchii]|uniref:hypothetical protein n=1 Tax=Leptospira noguchii TaxID=28182 RepID=UPI0012DA9DDA|nr:hypothetical protein [Leptospira noguchii]UOG59015.1 hypothetical protein MAL07_09195 [Leptospira noguchii]
MEKNILTDEEKISTRYLSEFECDAIKRTLKYRFGSVAKWVRKRKLSYGSVIQTLTGLAKHEKTLSMLAREGLYDFDKPLLEATDV